MTTTFKGNVVAPDGFFHGSVTFDERGILEIAREGAPRDGADLAPMLKGICRPSPAPSFPRFRARRRSSR